MNNGDNAWVTVNGDFWSLVRWFANDFYEWRTIFVVTREVLCQWFFTSDEVTSENHWQITSRVTKKSLLTVTNALFYSLHAFSVWNTPFRHKQSSFAHFAFDAKDGLFWINIVTSSQLICDVMRTRSTGHCDVTFVDCSCTHNWHKGDLR